MKQEKNEYLFMLVVGFNIGIIAISLLLAAFSTSNVYYKKGFEDGLKADSSFILIEGPVYQKIK